MKPFTPLARIFISFSGRLGYGLALAIRDWIAKVTSADLWLAPEHLTPGKIWIDGLTAELQTTDRAILCMTRDSLRVGWMHFEAGAAFKGLGDSQVVPYLLDFSPRRLREPLSIFQSVRANREGTLKLLKGLGLTFRQADFDREWPALDRKLTRLRWRSRIQRGALPVSLLVIVAALLGYEKYLERVSLFPQFEPARGSANTANSAPMKIERLDCSDGSQNCPRGYKHTLDAALSGGYATHFLSRWSTLDLQGRQLVLSVRFRKGNHVLEIGLTDDGGNAVFFDCRSDAAAALFSVPLH